MVSLQRLGSIETVIALVWDLTFTVFVLRLAFVYAALSLAATTLLAVLAHAAVLPLIVAQQQQHGVPQTPSLDHVMGTASSYPRIVLLGLVAAAVFVTVGACSRAIMTWAQIPQLRRFRAAIGAVAAAYVGLAWLAASFLSTSAGCSGHSLKAGHDSAVTPYSHIARTSAIMGMVFVAAVALMPWLSMALLERPSRWHGYHQRTPPRSGWTTPTKTARPSLEDEKAPVVETYAAEDDTEAVPRREESTDADGAKRYSLRTASERHLPKH
ncbi:MAG: hypothetical protein STHCBS139747_007937 [Sporothrix thermara]